MCNDNNKPVTGTMTVANLHAIGDLRIEQKEIPTCGDDEVLVKIKYCGVCGSDIPRILSKGTYHFPTVPGHEFSGQVVYDKSGEYTGKRVAVFPLLPCFACENCKEERYVQCTNYDYYGSRRDGAFAEYLAVKKFNLIELPEGVSDEEGAMCEPVSVANHAIKKLEIARGEHLLITGAGPIGLIAAMWARSKGAADIYFVDIDERKLELAKSFGFKAYDSAVRIDAVLEGTGASSAITAAIGAVRSGGRIVLMGNPSFDVSLTAKVYQDILRKEIHLSGTWNSSYGERVNDWKESLAAVSEGKLPIKGLISHKVALEKAFDAVKMMAERKEFYCKVMIEL